MRFQRSNILISSLWSFSASVGVFCELIEMYGIRWKISLGSNACVSDRWNIGAVLEPQVHWMLYWRSCIKTLLKVLLLWTIKVFMWKAILSWDGLNKVKQNRENVRLRQEKYQQKKYLLKWAKGQKRRVLYPKVLFIRRNRMRIFYFIYYSSNVLPVYCILSRNVLQRILSSTKLLCRLLFWYPFFTVFTAAVHTFVTIKSWCNPRVLPSLFYLTSTSIRGIKIHMGWRKLSHV